MIKERYNSIDKKISETEEQIVNIEKFYDVDSLEYAILTDQLKNRLKSQRKTLEESYLKESVKLIISGENVKKGKISTRILVAVLDGFQSVADSIANSLINEPTASGKIPSNILQHTDLELVNIFEGSFGVELEAKLEDNLVVDNDIITQTLDKFLKLLSSADDSDKVFDEVIENCKQLLGENITLKLIRNVTKNLSTGREKITWFLKEVIIEK